MKNKRSMIIWLVILVLLIVVIFIIAVTAGQKSATPENLANNQAATNSQATGDEVTAPEGTTTPSLYQGDSVELKPQIIVANGDSFEPKTIQAAVGYKINLVFQATDDKTHHIVFDDKILSFIDFTFSQAGGKKSVTFPAPVAGQYTFYVDSTTNTGTLTVK